MRNRHAVLMLLVLAMPSIARALGTVPTFQATVGEGIYTLLGNDPARGENTTIPTLLVPVTLTFHTMRDVGRTFVMDAAAHVERLRRSPVFANAEFPVGGGLTYPPGRDTSSPPRPAAAWPQSSTSSGCGHS